MKDDSQTTQEIDPYKLHRERLEKQKAESQNAWTDPLGCHHGSLERLRFIVTIEELPEECQLYQEGYRTEVFGGPCVAAFKQPPEDVCRMFLELGDWPE